LLFDIFSKEIFAAISVPLIRGKFGLETSTSDGWRKRPVDGSEYVLPCTIPCDIIVRNGSLTSDCAPDKTDFGKSSEVAKNLYMNRA
jgi:hypothetical protein